MAPRHHNGPYVLILAMALLAVACRKEQQPEPNTLIPEARSSPDTVSNTADKVTPTAPSKKRSRHKPETVEPPSSERTETKEKVIVAETKDSLPTPQTDFTLTKRFYLREQFANFDRPNNTPLERPVIHPDSMTWEDIAGPIVFAETPDWIRVLSYLGKAAGLAAVIYFLFLD